MFRKPANLMFATVAGTTGLVVLSSLAALVSSWRITNLFHSVVDQNLPARRTAEGLEISLLEQRGFVSSYVMSGGDPEWLEELPRRKADFSARLTAAQATASSAEQAEILKRLAVVYRRYDETRDEVVALYGEGRASEASSLFLHDLNAQYHEAYLLCEEIVATNQRGVASATVRANGQIRWITWMVFICVGLTFGLGSISLWGFAWGLRAEQARKGHEAQLLAAQRIQEQLLPDAVPDVPGFDIHSIWRPADFAAGDYYDYFLFPDGSLGVVIGDVSGHGIGPALLTASTGAYLRSLVETQTDISGILAIVNSILVRDVEEGRFITLVLLRVDVKSNTLTYVSAGHPTCYVFDGEGDAKARLESTAVPLGVIDHAEFPVGDSVPLVPGDVIALFSDGVLEAMSPEGEPFGGNRVVEVLRACRTKSAKEMAESLYRAVAQHVRTGKVSDDVTATLIKLDGRQP